MSLVKRLRRVLDQVGISFENDHRLAAGPGSDEIAMGIGIASGLSEDNGRVKR